jgi:hypothetical protein
LPLFDVCFIFMWGRGVKKKIATNLRIVVEFSLGKKWTYNLKHGVWKDCCPKIRVKDLGLVDREEVLLILLVKWVLLASRPNSFNLQILLHFCLSRIRPNKNKKWGANLNWVLCCNHQASERSHVWNMITKAWKGLVKKMVFFPTLITNASLNKEL